jgi:hypothetical protein
VTSAKHLYNFTVDQLSMGDYDVSILSVSSNGHYLLVGKLSSAKLHIYTTSGSHVTTLNVPDSAFVYSAAWTPRGNIVCTTTNHVMVLSIAGEILNRHANTAGWHLSVSQDGEIYVSNETNVLTSTDEGMSWSVKFSALDSNSYVQQAIKVSSDQYNDIFWTVETTKSLNVSVNENVQYLFICTFNKTADNAVKSVTRSKVTIPTDIQKYLLVNCLVFDGHSTMFVLVSDSQDVLMWSINGTFYGQLQLMFDNNNSPNINGLAVDIANHVMYVSPSSGSAIVSVFTLTYES